MGSEIAEDVRSSHFFTVHIRAPVQVEDATTTVGPLVLLYLG